MRRMSATLTYSSSGATAYRTGTVRARAAVSESRADQVSSPDRSTTASTAGLIEPAAWSTTIPPTDAPTSVTRRAPWERAQATAAFVEVIQSSGSVRLFFSQNEAP